MHAILRRLPSSDDLARNRGKIGGFVAGILGTLLLGLVTGVAYSGHGVFTDPAPDASPVYPNF